MPSVQTYIKEEDYQKYLSIKERGTGEWAEFIHNALNVADSYMALSPVQKTEVKEKLVEAFVPSPPDPETGYPCCQNKRKPCKHWHYDGAEGFWENEFTHERIDVA
jgi:hypothetical protein